MKVYLAGKMRGVPEFNFPAFDAGAATLKALGHTVFNPADRDRSVGFSTAGMTGNEDLAAQGFSLREALAADTEWISLHAEAVALLPGWQKSAGVAAEIALAHALGLPVGPLEDFTEDGPSVALPAPLGSSGRVTVKESGVYGIGGTPDSLRVTLASGVYADGEILDHGRVAFAKEAPTVTEAEARAIFDKTGSAPAFWSDSPKVTFTNATNEVRTTSATGGEKGTKPERYDLIPVGALAKVAALYGRGAAKYEAHNWRRGYEWSKSYAALQRHATQFWNGEDNDAEMDLPHMASVAFHALALLTFMEEQRAFDDRYKPAPVECCGENAACSNCP